MTDVDKIGPWSREKLDLLGTYLKTYTSILHKSREKTPPNDKWPKSIDYIDAFAGSVTPKDKASQEYINGSPLIALGTIPPFDKYIFIEKNKSKIKNKIAPLQALHPDKVTIIHGDCNAYICNTLVKRYHPKCGKRAFIFLDPYGLSLNWHTVEVLGQAGVFDVFINFSVMGIYRQMSKYPPKPSSIKRINTIMGCDDWISEVYEEDEQLTLVDIGKIYNRKSKHLAERLAAFYSKRLNQHCFKFVSEPIMMRMKSTPLYALILASQKDLAVKRMHEIFKRAARKRQGTLWP